MAFNDRGRPLLQATLDDITANKRAEEALRESEAYNKILFVKSFIPIAVLDPETDCILDCNPAATRIFGYASREAMLRKTFLEVSAEMQYDNSASLSAWVKQKSRVSENDALTFEWRHQRPDGVIWDAIIHLKTFAHKGKRRFQITWKTSPNPGKLRRQCENTANFWKVYWKTARRSSTRKAKTGDIDSSTANGRRSAIFRAMKSLARRITNYFPRTLPRNSAITTSRLWRLAS